MSRARAAVRMRGVQGPGPLRPRPARGAGGRRPGVVRVVAAAALAVVVLGACGTPQEPAGPETPAPTPTSLELPSRDGTPSPAPSAPDPEAPGVADAVADLAAHLGVDPADVTVVSLEDVTWPDGSLGCPKPGTSYTMAQVPGARLVLAAQGREFSYHAGREPVFVRCTTPSLAPSDPQ